jgi:hypothetical protein
MFRKILDFDGDSKADIAVYCRGSPNGVYYINESPNDLPVTYQ